MFCEDEHRLKMKDWDVREIEYVGSRTILDRDDGAQASQVMDNLVHDWRLMYRIIQTLRDQLVDTLSDMQEDWYT